MLDLTPVLNGWVYPLLALILTGTTSWLLIRSRTWLSAHANFLDASTKEKLAALENQALNEGANIIFNQVARAGNNLKVSIDSPVLRYGVQIALNHSASVLASNGADPDEVAAKILSRLPDNIVTTDTTGATVTTTTVTTQTLKPAGKSK